jgi:hypothetical protein
MAGMPYHLEKGPIFATIEALYNDPHRLPGFLEKLWNRALPLGDLGLIMSPMYDDKVNPQNANADGPKRRSSMLRSWFGDDANGNPQRPFSTDINSWNPTTGYWFHYYGNVREIVEKTLIRAAEVALGVDRHDPVANQHVVPVATRTWPVEFFWKCGQPRFEGWVTWRDHGQAGSGQVTVIFATPATPDLVLRRPAKGAKNELPVAGADWDKWQGMWVCSHADHQRWLMVTSLPTPSGSWIVPLSTVMFTEGREEVDVWAPTFGNGGAADAPKPFEPVP